MWENALVYYQTFATDDTPILLGRQNPIRPVTHVRECGLSHRPAAAGKRQRQAYTRLQQSVLVVARVAQRH